MIDLLKTIADNSKCQRRKVAAILCDENDNIISTGYNAVLGHSCCKRKYCTSGENLELCNSIHAEMLACVNHNIEGKTLYVNTFPCPICSKYLIAGHIKKIYYYEEYANYQESAALLLEHDIKLYKMSKDGSSKQITNVALCGSSTSKHKFFD